MRIETGYFGERVPIYSDREEARTAIRAFLAGNYGELTCDEVAFWRRCVEDPQALRWEREHAGELLRVSEEELDRELFAVRPTLESFADSYAWLRHRVGPHPITPLTLWNLMKF